ncbi:MAG TPA: DUF5668 domain-containing protein [candidate division Zixibacteria bacterium]|nr:DUF5668 domain-containing protein [candidate division Zixibacteria bacterium]
MNINRGLLFWGLALITAGVVALGVQQGFLDRDALAGAWRLWPVILIAIGLSIVLARTPFALIGILVGALVLGVVGGAVISVGPAFGECGGDAPDPGDLRQESGEFGADAASVTLEFDCGELEVAMADGAGWQTRTGASGDDQPQVNAGNATLEVRSPEGELDFFDGGRQRWEIELGSDVTYDLSVDVNAGDADLDLATGRFSALDVNPNAGALRIDLTGAAVEELAVQVNAGATDITASADSRIAGRLGINAGAVELCVPADVPMRFDVEGVAFGHNLDDDGHGLQEQGEDTWVTPGFTEADAVIDLRIEGNAGSFNLNPEGGCE